MFERKKKLTKMILFFKFQKPVSVTELKFKLANIYCLLL